MRELALTGMAMVVVTHEIGFAREVANQLVFVYERVVEPGDPGAVIADPQHERTRPFLAKVL